MYKILKIGTFEFPNPMAGNVTLDYKSKYKEYETEAGTYDVEVIRNIRIEGTFSYNGLLLSQIEELRSAVQLISTVEVFNPLTGTAYSFRALITDVSMTMIADLGDIMAWSLSFKIKEL